MAEKKSRILYVKRFLEEQTDEAHPAMMADILAYLESCSLSSNRRTVAQDIELLMEFGVDVVCNKGKPNRYFVGCRHFETPELKLLVDAAQASKFLTAKRSNAVIDKLLALTSVHQAAELSVGICLEHLVKPQNEMAYIAADTLLTAINTQRRVRFLYWEYEPDKKKTYKHGRRQYELSPYALVWNNDCYYVIGYSKSHGQTATFRIDRIAAPKLTDEPAIPAPEGFDIAVYVKSVFQMYDGPIVNITLRCENPVMKIIIDRFGEDVTTKIADEGHFYANVQVSVSKIFYGWVFSFDGAIEIVSPIESAGAYRDMLLRAQAKPCAIGKPH